MSVGSGPAVRDRRFGAGVGRWQRVSGMVGKAGPITVDELVALNEEIAALVRAGVPLERGLLRAGGELPGGLRRITQRWASG